MVTYQDGITVITPTGDRPFCLRRCQYYLERQTLLPDEWIVADDGIKKSAKFLDTPLCLQTIDVKTNSDKKRSFTGNLLAIIPQIKFNKIVVFEDDDWYHPNYIERTIQRLSDCLICGQSRALYYNVRLKRYRTNGNDNRASFCETAFRSELLCKLKKYCYPRTSAFVDARLWNHAKKNGLPNRLFQDKRLCVGIKGMPGRTGIGIGHRPPTHSYIHDPKWKKLKELIGEEDAQFYIDLHKAGAYRR